MSSDGMGVARVASLWRYPVKSMRGEELESSEVGESGLVGDRAFALFDVETNRVASAKSPRVWPNLLAFTASFIEPPEAGRSLPPVRIEMPDGSVVRTDDPNVDEALSKATGRKVALVTSNPEGGDFYREFPNDVFGTGSLHDASPIHLVTTGSLLRLAELYPEGQFDVRRFRPNVVVEIEGREPGFWENSWLKQTLAVGDVRFRVTLPTVRCVMTTLPQGDLPKDLRILRTAAQHNRLQVLRMGKFPCVGVNALVEHGGAVEVGQLVRVDAVTSGVS